jgi:uncharacterized membrane protein YoaK (UPF0700 family)
MHIRPAINRSRRIVFKPFTMLFCIGIVLALCGGVLHRFYGVPQIWALVGAAMMLASCAVALKERICALAKDQGGGSE